MTKNAILDELYDIRSRILADHGDDLRDYLHSELVRLKSEGHPIAQIKQRSIRCAGAAKSGESPTNYSGKPHETRPNH